MWSSPAKEGTDLKRVRVGIIGAGYWGPNLVRTFSSLPDCEVAYVCDSRLSRREHITEHFPSLRVTEHYDELLDDPELDAIAIATPAATHRELAEAALRAGKHTFVEKPLASNSADATAIVDAADRSGCVLATGHVYVYHPAVVRLREAVQAGELGRLCYAESNRVNLAPPNGGVDVIWDLAPHDVSILISLTGSEPEEVVAEGARHVHPHSNDVAFLKLRFPGGLEARVHVSWLSPVKVRRFFLAGTAGAAIFDDTRFDGKLVLGPRGEFGRPGQLYPPDLPTVLPLTVECQHFLDCIHNGFIPQADGRAGLAVVRVLESAELSAARGGVPVRVNYDTREIRNTEIVSTAPNGRHRERLQRLNPVRFVRERRLARSSVKLIDSGLATEVETPSQVGP